MNTLRHAAIALSCLSLANAIAGPAGVPVKIGAGLEGLADWSYSNAFADLVKQSRGFMSPDAPWSNPVAVDTKGWPTQDFGVVLAIWSGMKHVGGTYKISFVCKTVPTIATVASPGKIQNVARNAATGLVSADLIYPEGGAQLMLAFTGTQGGVRNLKVMRPGTGTTDVFTAPFLSHLARFENLRFMDWASTNGNLTVHWADRRSPSSPSYAGSSGVPWEVCIDLCNRTQKDAWINVPVEADDDYVHQLAALIHNRLSPKLHVYVEYSNEVWNWGFQQAGWNLAQAKAEVVAGGSPLNYDGSTNEGVWAARRIAKRIHDISNVFHSEFGDGPYKARVRPVLATQISWPGNWLVEGMKFLDDVYGAPDQYLYALAGAPYFNLGNADKRTNLTASDVLNALNTSVEAMRTDLNIEECATLATYHNLKFVAYEGGSDTFGPNNVAAKKAASLDPRLRPIVTKYLNVWYGYGFDLFNWFVAGATSYDGNYGTWGLTNDMTNQATPKITAIDAMKSQGMVALAQGRPVPGTFPATQFSGRDAKWATQSYLQLSKGDWQGPYRDYLLRVDKAGNRQLNLNAGANAIGVIAEVWINHQKVGAVQIPKAGSGTFVATAKLALPLNLGMNGMRLKLTRGDSFRVKSIVVN